MKIPEIAWEVYSELNLEDNFSITEQVLDKYQDVYIKLTGTRGSKTKKSNLQYNRKIAALNLIKIKRTLQFTVTEGFLYIIENKAWPNYYKIGMTLDTEERLRSYQTYSPKRDYVLRSYRFFKNRRQAEKELHKLLENERAEGEWFELPDVIIFLEKIKQINDR